MTAGTRTIEELLWELFEAYSDGVDADEPDPEEDGWPRWGSVDEPLAVRRRAWVMARLMTVHGLSGEVAEDLLKEVYWMQEHFVYSERELSEHIERSAELIERRIDPCGGDRVEEHW